MVAVPCDRCRSKVDRYRTKRVDYTGLNGLNQRTLLCPSCLRRLDEFLRGGDR